MQNKPRQFFSALLTVSFFVSSVVAQELRPVLSTASAKAIIAGCEAYAVDKGIDVAIAVTGPGDALVAFQKMDGVVPGAGDVAILKAISSSIFGLSSKQFATIVNEKPAMAALPKVVAVEGGEAIYTQRGVLIGGVGVSGAASADDSACARAGIKMAKLRFEKT
jgi:glc operon protein GlcG